MKFSSEWSQEGPIFETKLREGTVVRIFRTAMRKAVVLLERNIKQRTPLSDGILKRSISGDVIHSGGIFRGIVGSPLKYALPVERGIRPNRGFPNIRALKHWVQRQIKPKSEEIDSITYVIGRKIQKHGTKGKYMFREAKRATERQIIQIFENAGIDLTEDLD